MERLREREKENEKSASVSERNREIDRWIDRMFMCVCAEERRRDKVHICGRGLGYKKRNRGIE